MASSVSKPKINRHLVQGIYKILDILVWFFCLAICEKRKMSLAESPAMRNSLWWSSCGMHVVVLNDLLKFCLLFVNSSFVCVSATYRVIFDFSFLLPKKSSIT